MRFKSNPYPHSKVNGRTNSTALSQGSFNSKFIQQMQAQWQQQHATQIWTQPLTTTTWTWPALGGLGNGIYGQAGLTTTSTTDSWFGTPIPKK